MIAASGVTRNVGSGGGGYQQMQTSGLWFNRESGRVISREAVAAHDSEWLAHWITGQ